MHNLDLNIKDISKIEGKASVSIKVREGNVEKVSFSIAEYKRFYTQAIRGKDVVALPQLTARICGTCSNAHLLCAVKAVEDALTLKPSEQTVNLRKLLNFALNIRDHALHLYVFVLPDFFSKDSILDFDENNPLEHKFLDDTFKVKRAGNNLGKLVGGRSVHAPFVTVGGFTKIPKLGELKALTKELESIRPNVIDLIDFLYKNSKTLVNNDLDFAAISDNDYSFLYGDLIRSDGNIIPSQKYGEFLEHKTIDYSHASGYKFDGRLYMVGALARMNLAKKFLNAHTKKSIPKYLSPFPSKNVFHNNLAQAIEILHCIDSSIDIIKNMKLQKEPPVIPQRKKGVGIAVIEAPRGALYYKLEVDATGKIKKGQIVVPTGQNQISIEENIKIYLQNRLKTTDDKRLVEAEIEEIIRAYDPCMSCASHFLKVNWL